MAEGVETTEALGRLRALGCDQIQGYLLNRPRSPEDLAGQLFGDEHSPFPVALAPPSL